MTWVRPELVIRAELGGWSRDGIVRQGAFKGIEEGRDPFGVVREQAVAASETVRSVEAGTAADIGGAQRAEPVRQIEPPPPAEPGRVRPWAATDAELDALGRLGREGVWQVGGVELKLTNLDKAIFEPLAGDPAGPVTKRELVRYFALIAPAMLPHLAERPLNLHRFPDGANKPGFWQKDLRPTDPRWLRRWREVGVEAREANEHVVADGVATLAWLANQAAFEVHAWTSRVDAPYRPTFALIDIDPGTSTTSEETLVLARLYRTALEHLGVRGYPKVTGQRGVQIWIPILPRYDHGQTTDWVEKLSRAVAAVVPELVSWEWAKGARAAKARLDYTQNAAIKTLVAPYTVRPAPGAPGAGTDRLERTRGSGVAAGSVDDPYNAGTRRGRRGSVRRRPVRPPGAAAGLSATRHRRRCRALEPVRTSDAPDRRLSRRLKAAPPVTFSGNAIATRGLRKSYGRRLALDGLDLTVPAGVVYGFLGPNGAGKTTTMRVLTGLLHPDAGTVEILGSPYTRRHRHRLFNVGALVETPTFYPYLSGRDNLRALAASGPPSGRPIDEVLEVVGLRDRGGDKVSRYSLGMKQRLGIAGALLNDPTLLLLDEPANGLDPAGIVAMREMLRHLASIGKTVFVSSHLLAEVQQMADIVGIIAAGKLVREGSMRELLDAEGNIRVRVAPGEVAAALEVLARVTDPAHVSVMTDDPGWIGVQTAPARSPEINRVLAESGIYASELTSGNDLEDLFLTLTDNGVADPDGTFAKPVRTAASDHDGPKES